MNNSTYGPSAEDIEEQRRKRRQVDPNLWIVPFSDFMTIMMIFFLALYVMSMTGNKIQNELMLLNIEERFGGKVTQKKKMLEAASTIENTVVDRGLQKLVNVEVSAQRIKIIMQAPILFAVGSADLQEAADPIMDEIVGIVGKIPNKVTVEGHTDDLPVSSNCRYRSNLELSGARAFNVIRYFIEKGNLDPGRFVALGCADNIPIKPNDCPENRSLNRRVEISIEKGT